MNDHDTDATVASDDDTVSSSDDGATTRATKKVDTSQSPVTSHAVDNPVDNSHSTDDSPITEHSVSRPAAPRRDSHTY